jgi:histidine triad (HIT) family protein
MAEPDLANMSPEEYARLQKENCIFCKIIKGEISTKKVFEDDKIIAILDINPAAKGHTLIMTKEHYPILPVMPPEVFKHLFRTTKYIGMGIRDGVVSVGDTIFIANGAIAGQQSPHFLFHIIPREGGDDLSCLAIPSGKGDGKDAVAPSIKAGLASVMRSYLQREGLWRDEAPREEQKRPVQQMETEQQNEELQTTQQQITPQNPVVLDSKANLADTIFHNPELKTLIIEHPEKIQELMTTNEDIAELFAGVDIAKLSIKLREIEERKKPKKELAPATPKPNLDKISKLFR